MTAFLEPARAGTRTLVMGILNVTPDSFSDGGRFLSPQAAVSRALRMEEEGADLLDVGGESTRPGSEPVSEAEEMRRVLPVVEALSGRLSIPLSIDTTKAAVARSALGAGARMVNDISAMTFDPEMERVVAEAGCAVCLMHIRGRPKTMQETPRYTDVVTEVKGWLSERARAAVRVGIPKKNVVLDPGYGFGKTLEHNLELLRRQRELCELGYPVLSGWSRKSTIGKALGDLPVEERLEGTAACVALSIANGASIVRVHDVKAMVRVARMTDAIVRGFQSG